MFLFVILIYFAYAIRLNHKATFVGIIILYSRTLILCRDNANREQKHQACLNIMPRCSFSYAKITHLERECKF